jgi:hypothetical protein
MAVHLPFPGYSWPFTQHAVGLEAEILYSILSCAACFEGVISPGQKITELMIQNNLLTANVRGGKADAWRDYQQILAELGLIYSTNVVRALTLTKAGKLFLAGEIGFSELITQQALRYQYPNGQKSTIQSRLKSSLQHSGISIPGTLTELHVVKGVHLRPAVLILRVLLETLKASGEYWITISELMHCLMPIKRNSDWPIGLRNLINYRAVEYTVPEIEPANMRNAQDWFKFLDKSDLFVSQKGRLTLSSSSINNQDDLWLNFAVLEDEACTWIPTGFDLEHRRTWFDFFGSPTNEMASLAPSNEATVEYIEKNYIGGISEEDNLVSTFSEMNLVEHTFTSASPPDSDMPNLDLASALNNLRAGIMKRKMKTILHEQLVAEIAKKCRDKGGSVYEDPNSVDLLVVWSDARESLFEVKTVTSKSIQQRLRLALGQVQEYSYRRQKENGTEPDKSIVIDLPLPKGAWQIDFLNSYANTGLICKSSDDYSYFLPLDSSVYSNLVDAG